MLDFNFKPMKVSIMEQLVSSELKSILHSKRANLYYLEYCRVLVNNGTVEYLTEEENKSLYWNIPIANTTCVILGNGTSVTQAAMREFSKAGVLVGFCGGGGTPLYTGLEKEIDIAWFSPQSEYRPTEYVQNWIKIWLNDELRIQAAKEFQILRTKFLSEQWKIRASQSEQKFNIHFEQFDNQIKNHFIQILNSQSSNDLLLVEANLTKFLYSCASQATKYGEFTREKNGSGTDQANKFLDQGNYLAYGLGATACWVLGIPHSFSILHGKTRRGGLVFDVADLIKDGLILPQAFISGKNGEDSQEFRAQCIKHFLKTSSLDFMIDCIKETIEKFNK